MKNMRNFKMTDRVQELRRSATKQERHLWYDYLSAYPIRFKRQVVFDHYIVDFYCPKAKLIIELDGSQHFEEDAEAYDTFRTHVLNRFGCEVLRFTNLDIDRSFTSVCDMIDLTVRKRTGQADDKD